MITPVFANQGERTVDEQLKQLDPRLFLVRQSSPRGDFYEVRLWQGSETEPLLVEDWRDGADNPKPLSSGLAYAVERSISLGPVKLKEIIRKNEEHSNRMMDAQNEMIGEIAGEFQDRWRLGNFQIVPRSRGLYLARARARRRA